MKAQDALAEVKFTELCAHYKDTYELHTASIKQRDTLLYVLLAVLSVFSLQLVSSDTANQLVNAYVRQSIGYELNSSANFISTLLWLLLFGVTTRHYQLCVHIERQYSYIHALEESLSRYYRGSGAFTREGKSYLSEYPIFSNWLHATYTILLPAFVLFCIWLRISGEISTAKSLYPTVGISFFCYIMIGTSTILYLQKMHWASLVAFAKRENGGVRP